MINLTISMIIWRIFLSILCGFLTAATGWLLTIFLVKAVNTAFRPKPIHHIICFLVAVLSFVSFQFISATSTALHYIDQTSSVIKTELTNNQYLQQQLQAIIDQVDAKGKVNSKSDIRNFVAGVNGVLKQKYPIISKAVNLDEIEKNTDFQVRLTRSIQNSGKNSPTTFIEMFTEQYSQNLRNPLVRTRLILIIVLIGMQLMQAILMIIKANNSSAPMLIDAYDSTTDY